MFKRVDFPKKQKRNSISPSKKKTMGTSLKGRYEKLRDILEQRNEELEKERLQYLGCIKQIKQLREKYFGVYEAYFVDPNENAKNSWDKEYCALELVISEQLQKSSIKPRSNHDLDSHLIQSERQKNQNALSDLQNEREEFFVRMLEKDRAMQELHKVLKSSYNDVEMLSKEGKLLQQKLLDKNQQLQQQQEVNKQMVQKLKEYQTIDEYGTTNVLVQQEIDNLKTSKSDFERKYFNLKQKVGNIKLLKEENINLKLELDHRVKELSVENEKLDREYQILMKEYTTTKAKCKQFEDNGIKSGTQTLINQESQSKLSTSAIKDLDVEKQYYEKKIEALRKENGNLTNQLEAIRKQKNNIDSITYTKMDFEKMTAENTKRIKILEEKINDLTSKNKQLQADQQYLERLKVDIDNIKQLYEKEKIQNQELQQKINIQEKVQTQYQQEQLLIHEDLQNQLDETNNQIEEIKNNKKSLLINDNKSIQNSNSNIRCVSEQSVQKIYVNNSQQILNESISNLSQKSKNNVQIVEDEKNASRSNTSHKQSMQPNVSSKGNRNQLQQVNNSSSQDNFQKNQKLNTEQSHDRRQNRANSKTSNHSQQPDYQNEKFDVNPEDVNQQSKFEKEEMENEKKIKQLRKDSINKRKSFQTDPEEEAHNQS